MSETLAAFKESMMASLKELLDQQSDKICKLCEDISDVKQHMSYLNKTTENMSCEINDIKLNITTLNKQIESTNMRVCTLEKELSEKNHVITSLSTQLGDREQQGRLNNLEITGIPFKRSENLNTILNCIATKVGFIISPSDVDYIHRVRRYPRNDDNKKTILGRESSDIPNIIVRFTQRKRKSDMLAAVRVRRGLTTADLGLDGASRPVFINDHLAPHNKILFGKARKLGKELHYKYIWSRDCKMFLRKSDTSKIIQISNEHDLNKI
ncbi:unnamed protein product [Parnassius apollo]|nr:unnamed protein product [Parnassius apollo]CAG5041934.1 unnamed protein product [Parnassius apollo]